MKIEEKNIHKQLNCNGVDKYIYKNQQRLRFGYTTGSCAAAAAKAAALIFLRGNIELNFIELMTPKGILLKLKVLNVEHGKDYVSCAIKKDSGDDPDVTNGMLIYATVSKIDSNDIVIDGGTGVGRITKEGLQCPVGSAAINRVPRKMIYDEVKDICEHNDYKGGLLVKISIPGGEEIAKKTFNPRLGIVGGISILGTSGIIEPMSESALIETIRVEMKQLIVNGEKYLVITPGNYGKDFLIKNINIDIEKSLKCSNFVGETIDSAIEFGAKGILFIAHIGKFVKVAGGIMNTHSRNADSRMEIITANAAVAGAQNSTLKDIMKCITTEEAIDILVENDMKEKTMNLLMKRIDFYLKNRAKDNLTIGAVIFSNKHGVLGQTKDADELLEILENN